MRAAAAGLGLALLLAAPSAPRRAEAASPAPAHNVARFALVVGNNRPERTDIPSLRYADDDAVATHALLVEAGVDSVLLVRLDDDSLKLHPEVRPAGPPRGAELDRAVATLTARMRAAAARGAAVELLFFYSGHGDVDGGEGYVVLEDRRVTRTMLHALLAASPATRNHVFIDACKSYYLAFEKGPGGARSAYAGAFVPDAVPGHLANSGFVLSTSSGRESHEWERYQAGILSHEVRSALRGAADTDGDGTITYAELAAFLATANRGIPNPRYRPDFMVRPPGRDVRQEVLRWTPDRARSVQVVGGALGHVYVETAAGERVLDAHPAGGQALSLRVPDQRPLFVRRNDESAEQVVEASAPPPPIAELTQARPAIAMRGAMELAFENLFATPFADRDVREIEVRAARADLVASPSPPTRPAWRSSLRTASGAVAIGGAVASLALGAVALREYQGGAGASQVELAEHNTAVRRLNIAAIVCLGAAAAGGATWAWLRWTERASVTVEPAPDTGVIVGIGGRY